MTQKGIAGSPTDMNRTRENSMQVFIMPQAGGSKRSRSVASYDPKA